MRLLALVGAAVQLLGGGVTVEEVQRQPAAPNDGLQATGRIDGSRIVVSYGDPAVTLGDCDPRDATDTDLCLVSRTIGGSQVTLVIENPDVLAAGETVPVEADPCATCDDVAGLAVVEVRYERGSLRARGGRLQVTAADERYTATFDLRLPGNDQLVGEFNVRPGTGF